MERGDKMSDGTRILESDTDLREDIDFMVAKNWHEAEHKKSEMEQRQRDDAKLRKTASNNKK
jgi:hypothetical protein